MESSVRKYSEHVLARDPPKSPRGGRNLEAGGPNPLPSLVLSLLRTQRQALGQAVRRPDAHHPHHPTDAATAPLFMSVANAKPSFLFRA